MELIITEKDNAARRIADILSGGTYDSSRENGVNVYEWGGKRCVGLSGHVVGVDFPSEYSDWRDVEPVELIDADVEKTATKENIVATLRLLTRRAERVTIATDYDREGELIGKEAYDIVREVDEDVPIRRVRFSSITENEVQNAFDEPDDLDFDLAAAGEARQIIDLIWGAALTRFLSLSAGQLGDDFISVGRVQSPTLKLIVDREREIEAFDPEDYWELFADLRKSEAQRASETSSGEEPRDDDTSFESQYFYRDEDGNEAERVWEEETADEVYETLADRESATVVDVNRRTRTDTPPEPFNTTQFIRAAGAIGYSAKRAMSIAEDLYTAGYITYPRTDNTVYPDDLDPEELLDEFTGHSTLGDSAESLLEADEITPTEGDEETTDHPPIHPTGEIPSRGDVSDDEWEIFELVVRRFYATVADAAEWEHLKVVADVDDYRLKANGKRLVEPGYHDVYPYFSTTENFVPDVDEGEELALSDVELEAKQTQPPRRYGQSRLIETMEGMGIGTKSTRHNTLEKLYDRGYIESDPPRPTKLAMAVVDAAENYADRVVSEEMTAQLEADMDAIANGEATLDDVTDESREMLEEIFENLAESREEIGDHLRKSLKDDKRLGPCPECGEDLLVRRSRHGSYFIGCDGYPDCENTLPLPSTGKPLILEDECEDHGLNEVKMLAGRQTFVHGCPLCKAEDAGEGPVLGECPDCGAEHGGELAIKTLQNGSRLVGCTRYPDCEYSLPLPRRGEIEVTDEYCDDHDLPELVVHSGDDPWELGCPICNYQEFQARESDSGSDLESLDGVGAKTVEKLADAGIEDLEDLTEADPDAVADDVEGVSADRIRSWQAKA
ncbi:DNA topoisomerase I [Natrinema pellirubrum DSM 15624]|uniref:DNA topoisomerase 1 n=1 Tax=Natrinema pellirubrum (strain DSM 15624 / CIP 106293 / JCM 10476 / NCIMB 786 / 157) TaxID=797303 RepID=L0JPU4_NATP1|nr:DNA topoisomerase [Natrinema pellirubrum]AGB32632.1 topoisomerase IA [Natrinema pellirubrum DSM 15624]ELY73765.1 DNA topoisomerase I [Natrinema pellirubrum DSM 15624]